MIEIIEIKDDEACARLAEAVIHDAIHVCKRGDKEAMEKVHEFSKRMPNPLLEAYCEAFTIDEKHLRGVLWHASLDKKEKVVLN